ncbi:MAG TPA: tetratricopeptide repeat protein [Nevskiaceae bacterium]|nr:tetratricopeptide repeat protein [Nevskiaceae bacterium]
MNTCTEAQTGRWRRRGSSLAAAWLLAAGLSGCAALGGHTAANHSPASSASSSATATAAAAATAATPDEAFAAALQLMKTHQDAKAVTAFTALTQRTPKDSGPYTNLGILYGRSGQWRQAATALTQAAAIKPDNAIAWNWLGIAQRHLGNYTAALAAYQRALKAQPGDANAHFNLGVLYDRYLHRPQQAINEYQAYQRDAKGGPVPIVTAWIKGLEHGLATPTSTHHSTP